MARSRMIHAALGALACALAGSCVDDSVSVRIDCVLPPSNDCTYSAGGELCWTRGLLNLSTGTNYFGMFRVTNSLRARARTSPPLAEPNGLNIDGFDVHILTPSGASYDFGGLPNPFFATATGWAAPGGGKTPASAYVLPEDYVTVLRKNEASARTKVGSVVAEVSVRATTDGQVSIESDAIRYPIAFDFASSDYADGECTSVDDTICTPGQDSWAFACNPSTVPE